MAGRRARDPVRRMAAECLAERVRMVSRAVTGIYDEALRATGIRVSQLNLLVYVASRGSVGPTPAGRELCLEKSTLSRNVARMVRQGWLEVVAGAEGRSQNLRATEEGLRLIQRAYPMWRRAQNQARALLGEPGAAAVGRLAGQINAAARPQKSKRGRKTSSSTTATSR